MSVKSRTPLEVVRILFAISIIILTGFWGLMTLFSDPPVRWTLLGWGVYILAGHAVAGFLVGLLLPLRWTLAIGSAWGAVLVSLAGVIAAFSRGGSAAPSDVSIVNQVAFTFFAVVAIPTAVALAAYAGSRATRRNNRSS